jgi:hypothetical protein
MSNDEEDRSRTSGRIVLAESYAIWVMVLVLDEYSMEALDLAFRESHHSM